MENRNLAMMNPPACITCKHWDQRYPQNPMLGVCQRMGATLWNNGREISISVTTNPELTTDVDAVRTLDTFGCRLHSDYISMQIAGTL